MVFYLNLSQEIQGNAVRSRVKKILPYFFAMEHCKLANHYPFGNLY
ncbi:hypothetical protein [Coleofasciculus sp.]